jgi:hypothetical protein
MAKGIGKNAMWLVTVRKNRRGFTSEEFSTHCDDSN